MSAFSKMVTGWVIGRARADKMASRRAHISRNSNEITASVEKIETLSKTGTHTISSGAYVLSNMTGMLKMMADDAHS